MSKLHSLARIVLTYAIISAGMILLISIPSIFVSAQIYQDTDIKILYYIFTAVFTLLFAGILYILITRHDVFVQKLVGQFPAEEAVRQIDWLWLAFRLMAVYFAITFFPNAVRLLLSALREIILIHSNIMEPDIGGSLERIGIAVISIAIWVYLLFGAPHFVRWQVWKTLEQCRKLENSESSG